MNRYYDAQKKRLVYFGMQSSPSMWDQRWEYEDIHKVYFPKSLSMEHETILAITKKYLPPNSQVLEGGCGLGDKVHFLKQAGYRVIGIDYAKKTVEMLNEHMPDLDIRYGDLQQLDFPDSFFDGYWSLGVIEHFYDGYDQISCEIFRTLKEGGYLFLTVPAMSGIRRMKAALGLYPRFENRKAVLTNFYQFAYGREEIKRSFCQLGFQLIEIQGFSDYKGVRDEIPGTRLLMSFLCRYFKKMTWHLCVKFFNHMDLYVFRKY